MPSWPLAMNVDFALEYAERMTDPAIADGIEQNKALKKQMLDKHRPAFELWRRLAELMEEAVVKGRRMDSSYARALDIFFVEAFKSHQSLYLLCINGHGEDAATICRRLFEIALQAGYLCSEPPKCEERGKKFLAHFWHNAKDMLAADGLPEDRRKWWKEQNDTHKQLLTFKKNGQPATHWFGSSFAELASTLGLKDAYEKDYRFLSQMAHCSSRGLLLGAIHDVVQIKTDRLVREILIYGTRYALWVSANWDGHFHLIGDSNLKELRDDALNFDFKTDS